MRNNIHRLTRTLTAPPYTGLIWAAWLYVVVSCLLLRHGPFDGELAWFDDNVRMTQVLNWINDPAGLLGGWHDRTIMRVNPPEGFRTIWSRLVDVPIGAIIMALRPAIGQPRAVEAASIILPLLQSLLLFFAAGYFAKPLLGRRANLVTIFVLVTSCFNVEYFTLAGFETGAAGHHAWYVLTTLMFFGALGRLILLPRSTAAIVTGGGMIGALLAVGIEGFPLLAGGFGLIAIVAWWNRDADLPLSAAKLAALGAFLALLLLPANRPPGMWLTVSYAEHSILGSVLVFSAALFLAAQYAMLRQGWSRKAMLAGMGITAVVLGGALVAAFPLLLKGGAAALSPAERILAAAEHSEAKSLFSVAHGWLTYIRLIASPLLALCGGWFLLRRAKEERRRLMLAFYIGLAALGFVLASTYSRYFHYAQLTACPLLLEIWLAGSRAVAARDPYRLQSGLLYFVLAPFWMVLIPAFHPGMTVTRDILLFPARHQVAWHHCDARSIAPLIDADFGPGTLMLTELGNSAKILFHTHVRLMFLANYPSQDKFVDAKAFYDTTDPEQAKTIIRAHNVDLVEVCTDMYPPAPSGLLNSALVQGHLPFGHRLAIGNVPDWLTPVPTPGIDTHYRLFTVDKDRLAP